MKVFIKPYFYIMNNHLSLVYLIALIAFGFTACRGPEVKENKSITVPATAILNPVASEKYVVDTKESVVVWHGSNAITSKGSHTGYASISKGELLIDKTGKLVGGAVDVDMNSLSDEKHGSDNNLIQHLKSSDFFETEKFPTSTFAIVMTTAPRGDTVNVTGILNMKGIAQTITFPATIKVMDGTVQASGKLTIDRTKWGVRYKSKSFVFDMADDLLSDDISFDVKIVGKK